MIPDSWNVSGMKLKLSWAICGSKNSHFEVGLDLLIINSELSIMHQNSIKERNQSIISWHNLTKSTHSFEFYNPPLCLYLSPFVFDSPFLSVVWVKICPFWRLSCEFVLCLCCLSCLSCVWVCLSVATLSKRMFPSLCHWMEGDDTFQKVLAEVFKGLNHWLFLTIIDTDKKQKYKHHCLLNDICMLPSAFIVVVRL